jgi:hypothetical protein
MPNLMKSVAMKLKSIAVNPDKPIIRFTFVKFGSNNQLATKAIIDNPYKISAKAISPFVKCESKILLMIRCAANPIRKITNPARPATKSLSAKPD